jgi:CheY-like chemotaxis protein
MRMHQWDYSGNSNPILAPRMTEAPEHTGPVSIAALIVEDSPHDSRFLVWALEKADYEVTWERTADAQGLKDLLAARAWDLVFSDHNMPGFSGPEALTSVHTPCKPRLLNETAQGAVAGAP